MWVIGGFLLCPCHLPLTVGLFAAVLGGTAVGAALRDHPLAAGSIIAAAWAAATWRGVYLLRLARAETTAKTR